MIPMLRPVKNRNRVQQLYFIGINRKDMIRDNELTAGKNLDSDDLPALSPRHSREVVVQGITTPYGFGVYKGQIYYQDGATFYYGGLNMGTNSSNFKSFAEFNKELIIMPDKKSFDGATLTDLQGTIYIERGDLDENGLVKLDETKIRTRGYIMVVGGETITFSNDNSYTHDVYEFDKDFNFIEVTTGLIGTKTVRSDTENVKIVLNGSDVNTVLTVNTTKGYPSEGEIPDISQVVEHYNRLFGIKDNSIYASAWADKDNWAYFHEPESGSWAIDTRSEGDFIAISNYQNHVVFFKPNEMLELYGYNPSDFQLQSIADVGCVGAHALCEMNNALYFISKDDVYQYTGGIPRPIGEKLNLKDVSDGIIIGSKNKLYICVTEDGVTYQNYVYDVLKGSWLPTDTKQVLQYFNDDGDIYALTADGTIEKYDSGVEKVAWGFTTKNFNDGSFNYKVTTRIRFRMKIAYGATVSVFVKYDQGDWETVKTYENMKSEEYQISKIILAPQRHQMFQVKVECKGEVIIWGEREVHEVSDVNVKN